ncbi:MAG: hypothetical protein ACRCX2_28950 [Paraclostridium sp.]
MNKTFKKRIAFLCLTTTISSTLIFPSFASSTESKNTLIEPSITINSFSNYEFTKEEILQLEPYVNIDESGKFKLNSQDALINGIDSNLLDGQQKYFDYLNTEVNKGNIHVNEDLTIEGMTEIQKQYEQSIMEHRCSAGRNTSMATHWWGVSRYTCDHNTKTLAKDFQTAGTVSGVILKWFPGFGAIPAIGTAAYLKLVGARITANNHGRGVLTEISWAFVFDITPQ